MRSSKKKREMLPMCSAKGYFAGKKDARRHPEKDGPVFELVWLSECRGLDL